MKSASVADFDDPLGDAMTRTIGMLALVDTMPVVETSADSIDFDDPYAHRVRRASEE